GVRYGPISEATAIVVATPPISPSQVLFGLTFGVTLRLPNSLPQQYCATSLNWASTTRKNNSPPPPATGFAALPATRRIAIWLKPNTVSITPQVSVPTA